MTLSSQSLQECSPQNRVKEKKLEDKKVERLLAILAKKMESARENRNEIQVA
jgi:hypothetical protein